MQEDDLLPISIPALAESSHTPDSYPVPSIPQRSSTPASVSTVILESTSEPALPKPNTTEVEVVNPVLLTPNTAEVEVVDLAGPTYSSGGKGGASNLGLKEQKQAFKEALATQLSKFHGCGSTEQEGSEHQEIALEGSVGLEAFVEPVVEKTVPDILGDGKLMEPNSHATTAESWEKLFTGCVSKDEASSPPIVSLLQAK